MLKAEIDRPKLEKSLKAYAKQFGDTSAQAVIRWSVNACRELAFETQVWGKSKTKDKQQGAILADAYNVVIVVDELKRGPRGGLTAENQGRKFGVSPEYALLDAESVKQWIDQNRIRRNGRTAKLPPEQKKIAHRSIFNKAMRDIFKLAGMAKGAWLGAGRKIAMAQKGGQKVTIGKNYLGYAQKHMKYGTAKQPVPGWKPQSSISNELAYSAAVKVLTESGSKRAIDWSLKKTIKWYQSALKANDKKKTA